MISRETDADLWNWARWLQQQPLPHPLPIGRAASAEGRYLPPSDLGDVDAPKPPPPVNTDRAKAVQKLYEYAMSTQEKFVIREEYPYRHKHMRPTKLGGTQFDRSSAARKLGMPLRVYSTHLRDAAKLVSQTLAIR
jgi:hypothetical protein